MCLLCLMWQKCRPEILELESRGELTLPLTEQRAVGASRASKRSVESQGVA